MDSVLGMIGFAKRAGKVVTGTELCEAAVKNGKSRLIIIAGDISENGRKSITDACKYYKVKYIRYGDKAQLGKITGADERAAVSVNDGNFARAVLKKYAEVYDRKE